MKVDTADATYKNISYHGSSFQKWKDYISNELKSDSHHLCLFLGLYKPDKKKALEETISNLDWELITVDMNKLISKIESEAHKKMDTFFEAHHEAKHILYFKNGDKLCGSYTGNTASRVKYATPQERYFIKKVKAYQGLVIVDITEFTDADRTLRRAAQSTVSFTLPDSKLKRFFWHLKNYTFQGSNLKTKRPDAYGDTALEGTYK